jgi:serine/threonine protein kinase
MAATGGAGTRIPMLMIGENSPNYGPGGNITRNGISANQTLVEEFVGPYSLSFIKNRDGTRRMVRKITQSTNIRRGQFDATVREADVYNDLIKNPDYKEHILPFVRSKRTNDWVYIDFDYVNGMDFEQYLSTLPTTNGEEQKRLLLEAIRHLQWLLSAGYSHGDVKLNNFYIDTTTGKTYIIDFGTSRKLLSMGGIYADIFKLLNMASILFPGLTDEAEHAIFEKAKAVAKSTTSTAERGIQMYANIAEQLATAKRVSGGRRRTQRYRKRRVRRTHRSIPRIIR